MENVITVIHILAAAGVIGLVLLQHGKGADMGAAFGSGASGSLFGVSGSSNFMSKATAGCVAVFFVTSLTLAYLSSHHAGRTSVVKVPTSSEQTTSSKVVEVKSTEAKDLKDTSGNAAGDIPK